ncbi:Eukaryotic translation initiation factor 4 gamma 3 [Halotydeus destructor]|nr:Eukaryotic translation initiation factor 4 gamma 3 [Halotydeus destructor]
MDRSQDSALLTTFGNILDSITPQNFLVSVDEISKLAIDTVERRKQMFDLVFDKVIDQPAFCVQYAQLGKHLNIWPIVKLNEELEEESRGKSRRCCSAVSNIDDKDLVLLDAVSSGQAILHHASESNDIDELEETQQESLVDHPDQLKVEARYVYERSTLIRFRIFSQQRPVFRVERSTDLDRLSHIILDHARLDDRLAFGKRLVSAPTTEYPLGKFCHIFNTVGSRKILDVKTSIDKLLIANEDCLKRVLDLLFIQAATNSAFCGQYAELCKHMSKRKIYKLNDDQKIELVDFRKLLLNQCRKDLDTDKYVRAEKDEPEAALEVCDDADGKKLIINELERTGPSSRMKRLGITKLIGELFKLEMVPQDVILLIMHKLANEEEEGSPECLCTLMETVGKKLKKEYHKAGKTEKYLEPYFKQLEKILWAKTTSPGLSARIQNVLDLHYNVEKVQKNASNDNLPKKSKRARKTTQRLARAQSCSEQYVCDQ